MMDVNVVIGGAAGEGIQTVGSIFSDALARCGLAVFSWQEYESRIRGGLNSYSIRVSTSLKNAPRRDADVLLPLRKEARIKYRSWLNPGGLIIAEERDETDDATEIYVPFGKLARDKWQNPIYANTIALGALWSVIGGEFEAIRKAIEEEFYGKSEKVIRSNVEAARDGYTYAEESCQGICSWRLEKGPKCFYLIAGNPAIALGAVRAGCRFMAAYPMTPATGIITFLAQHRECKVFTEQAEDEIAAINMAIGAQFAGTRAMTATSGGGFSLMVEALSLAGMVEVPVVIVLAQRPGPATGLPTRTAQGDLLFAIHAGHGEFPRAVFAPSDPYDAFHKMVRAFNIADKYQIPVIVMTDQFLADSQFSIDGFDVEASKPEFFFADPEGFIDYRRYTITPSGISPRLYPGQSKHLVTADSDEHDEEGHITEDLDGIAVPMIEKRLRKIEGLRQVIEPPERFLLDDAEEILVGWGSTKNSIFEAVEILRGEGKRVGAIHFTEIWPFPQISPSEYFPPDIPVTVIEQNAIGQFASLLSRELPHIKPRRMLFYNGLPVTAKDIRRRFYGGPQ
ncbi:MAG: 2-oxoacid:acceptor oxidoreductase subunit alpha [Syntrophobacterales bacterium]|nr:2-oxoacid:acceptor oxidoreductase subunit alpha [Syntrophobacterales bacterium]